MPARIGLESHGMGVLPRDQPVEPRCLDGSCIHGRELRMEFSAKTRNERGQDLVDILPGDADGCAQMNKADLAACVHAVSCGSADREEFLKLRNGKECLHNRSVGAPRCVKSARAMRL